MDPSDSGGPAECPADEDRARARREAPAGAATVERLARALDMALGADEPLLVGVSGGSDSVALMGLAARARPGRVAVLHVDHGVRAESAADAAFVAGLAAELGLPCRVERPSRPLRSSETALRAFRLERLARAAREQGVRHVLLAHHGDDTRETILLHGLRGHRGLRARAGMPAWRPFGGDVVLVRPWLLRPRPPGRVELARARAELGLPHVEDASNADARTPRVCVRRLLEQARAPLTHARVERLRLAARARLQGLLGELVGVLARDLHAEGHGVRLDRGAFDPPPGAGVDPTSWRTELLRLTGACLEPATRPQLRRGVLRSLDARLRDPRAAGSLDLPAAPHGLRARLGPAGLHLADARLVPGDGFARALTALGRTPLP